jgi:hypothetical protein
MSDQQAAIKIQLSPHAGGWSIAEMENGRLVFHAFRESWLDAQRVANALAEQCEARGVAVETQTIGVSAA